MNSENLKVYGLYEDGRSSKLAATIRVPEGVSQETIVAAWAHAVMYSAKGLTIPDYEAAANLLIKRHPSWELVGHKFVAIKLDLAKADNDIPE